MGKVRTPIINRLKSPNSLNKAKIIMNTNINNSILPEDFDGVWRFTNGTGEDFTAKWGGVAYTFPAMKTTPMIIPGATPEEHQHIRKKFAKELAEREFYKTPRFKGMDTSHLNKDGQPTGGFPATYTDNDLVPFIQKCLEPLPLGQVKVKVLPKDDESKYHKDDDGKNVTRPLKKNESLLGNEGVAIE
jgi:hypothetical protein